MANPDDPRRLDGKVAVITGATGGIGEATAKLFLELGAKVMLVGRNAAKLAETCGRLGSDNCATALADSTDELAIKAAVDETVERFGALHIMVANAGTEGVLKPVE
jgi:NADP-dependent 3-hydroxy acid dehydrogenase YdfG